MDIEETLRRAAQNSGTSILALSKRSGVGYNALYYFTKGTRSLRLTSASRLADALGLELKPIKKRKGA